MREYKDITEYKDIFVLAEVRGGAIMNVSFELLGAARQLSRLNNEKVCAVLIGYNVKSQAHKLIEYGADTVFVADSPVYEHYSTQSYTDAATYLVKEYSPSVLLIGATALGRDLAPRLSARIETGLTADCTKLEMKEDGLYMTRPAFGGNLFAVIVCPEHRPQMSTVRPGVMKPISPDKTRKGEIIEFAQKVPEGIPFKLKLIEERLEAHKDDKIENAKTLVSLGRGAGRQNLEKAAELAMLLNGLVSASRAMVDAGHIEQARQVGQTGKTVRPECYIALGISGAIQHLAGMEESDYIIAVNKDKGAPIFNTADLCVVGDVNQILPLLCQEISKAKNA